MRHITPILFAAIFISGCEESRTSSPAAPAAPSAAVSTPTVPAVPVKAVPIAAPAAKAQTPVPPPPAGPPATLARAGVGEPHWLSAAGWKSGGPAWSNPTQIRVVPEAEGAGARAVEIVFTGGAKDKAAIVHTLAKEDLAPHPGVALTVLNRGDAPVRISVAIKTGKASLYHESAVCLIPAKTAKPVALSYDLEASVFRTLATTWQPTSAIADLGELKEVEVVILNGSQSGTVVIGDVQIREQAAK